MYALSKAEGNYKVHILKHAIFLYLTATCGLYYYYFFIKTNITQYISKMLFIYLIFNSYRGVLNWETYGTTKKPYQLATQSLGV